jgi:hypothetical protein
MWSGRKGPPAPYQLIYIVFQMYEDCQAPQGTEMIHYFSVSSVISVAIHWPGVRS